MTVFSSFSPSRTGRALWLSLALLGALASPSFSSAQDASNNPPKELEEKTSTELEKLKPLLDAKNWDGALTLIGSIKAGAKPESYDTAFLTDVEAKIYLQKGDYVKSIAPWETALRLSDAYHFFDANTVQDMIYFLAQIYYQEGTASKVPSVQTQNFGKATAYLERWIANTKRLPQDSTRQEAQVFYASLLYNWASINQEKVNMDLLKRADAEVAKALRSSTHPRETFYVLSLAIGQQLGDYPRLADTLELLVKHYPGKKDYWSQLAGVYGNLAALETKDEAKARENNIRAIITIERAQALGFMKTPKDNYTLFGIYYNLGQFGRATEILHSGLRDGSIEPDLKNWELLGASYQQVDKPLQAVDALKEGSKHFTKTGQLDFQISQIYYSLNRAEDSYKHLQLATSKGHLEKPGAVYGFMGYVCWELGKLEEARDAVQKAINSPDGQKDTQLPKLKDAIEEAIRERDAPKAAGKSA